VIAGVSELIGQLLALELAIYGTAFAAHVGHLLIATGDVEQARVGIDAALGLAADTGMHFYDAELLRLRAQTQADEAARQADLGAALELARTQGAAIFELRAAMDDVRVRGESAHPALEQALARFASNSRWPELVHGRQLLGQSNVDIR
jgi:hypothetical protein